MLRKWYRILDKHQTIAPFEKGNRTNTQTHLQRDISIWNRKKKWQCRFTFQFTKWLYVWWNIYLLHRWLSIVTFIFFWNISSIFSIFWITLTIFRWIRIDATTRKQNAQKPEYRLYESINWRTIFLDPSSALMLLFDIQMWKML